jgi:hypothetical protein
MPKQIETIWLCGAQCSNRDFLVRLGAAGPKKMTLPLGARVGPLSPEVTALEHSRLVPVSTRNSTNEEGS